MARWLGVFDMTVPTDSNGNKATLKIGWSERDLVCYRERFCGPMNVRAYDKVWDILGREVEEVVADK